MRSYSEACVAAGLDYMDLRWYYEPKRFNFEWNGGKWSYLPDFLIIHERSGLYIEVKPSLDSFDLNRVRAFYNWSKKSIAIAVVSDFKSREATLYGPYGDDLGLIDFQDPYVMDLAVEYRAWHDKYSNAVHEMVLACRPQGPEDPSSAVSVKKKLEDIRPPQPYGAPLDWAQRAKEAAASNYRMRCRCPWKLY